MNQYRDIRYDTIYRAIARSYTEYKYKDIERETERERENNQHVDT